jgi:hypothetical protein
VFLGFIDAVIAEAENTDGNFDEASDNVFESMDEEDSDAFFEASIVIDEASSDCGLTDDSGDPIEEVDPDLELGDPQPVPGGLADSEEEAAAQACFEGDLGACDELYAITDIDSIGEDYGSTCGGRIDLEDEVRGDCEEIFG